jgi:hypothetical protein
VRDNLADSLSTLPGLLEGDADPQQIHFFMANLNGMRKQLSPSLVSAYQHWLETGERGQLRAATDRGADHWQQVALQVLENYRKLGDDGLKKTQDLIEQQAL